LMGVKIGGRFTVARPAGRRGEQDWPPSCEDAHAADWDRSALSPSARPNGKGGCPTRWPPLEAVPACFRAHQARRRIAIAPPILGAPCVSAVPMPPAEKCSHIGDAQGHDGIAPRSRLWAWPARLQGGEGCRVVEKPPPLPGRSGSINRLRAAVPRSTSS
jgi:hypothetical protein